MRKAAKSMRRCAQSTGKHLSLRGGGGGGAGFETYFPWNITSPDGSPEDITPNAVSFGYGFQFALGPASSPESPSAVRLQPNAGFAEAAFVSCPGSADDSCYDCVEEASSPVDGHAISLAFACSNAWATQVCELASYRGTPYGKFAHYSECNCPVSGWYLARYLPNTSAFKPQKKPHCYPGEDPSAWPSVTPNMLKAHCTTWCGTRPPRVGGFSQSCPILPGCECLLEPSCPTTTTTLFTNLPEAQAGVVVARAHGTVLAHLGTALVQIGRAHV